MLRIEPLRSYTVPRYPQGAYYEEPNPHAWLATGGIASAALLAALASSCIPPIGVVGPPPVPPEMVTEKEARAAIERVFTKAGITMEPDVVIALSAGGQAPVNLDLDGYNKERRIGYEYFAEQDYSTLDREAVAEINQRYGPAGNGPYVKAFDTQYIYNSPEEANAALEKMAQDFIDELKARGVI